MAGTFSKDDLGAFLLKGSRAQTVAVDKLLKFQPDKQVVKLFASGFPHQVFLRRKLNGRVPADGRQVVGQIGALLAVLQLFKELSLHVFRRQVLIDPVQSSEFFQQVSRRFGPDARYAGDIVGAVAHEGFQVDKAQGFQAVFLKEHRRRVVGCDGLACLGAHQLHRHVLIHQLQAVAVAGEDDALPALPAADVRHSADDVVGLPALTFVDGDIHGGKDLLHHGHLHGKLLGHPVAGRLVALVLQMAEGGAVEVKGNAQGVGLFLHRDLLQNIQEAEDGVGIQALPGGQRPHAVKGAVDDAVAIQYHQLHSVPPIYTRFHFAP